MISARFKQRVAPFGFLGALALAAVVRGYLFWQYYCISSDGVLYIRAAQDFFALNLNAGLQSLYPPGYSLVIAAVYPVMGDWELAGQWVSIGFGIALLMPLYGLFKKMFDVQIATLACYLAALSPFLALYSVHVRSESIFLFLSAAAIYLFFLAIESRALGRFFTAGLIAGYAFLVRPEAIGFLVIVPAVLVFRWWYWREHDLNVSKSVAALSAGFMILALPYIVYLSVDTGHFGAISRKAGLTLAINLQESGLLDENGQKTDVGSFAFTEYVVKNPFAYIKKVASDVPAAALIFFQALYYSYVPFLVIGLFVALRQKRFERSQLLLVGFVVFYVFGFALFYVKRRYALQAVPLSLAWVSLGIIFLWRWTCQNLSSKAAYVTCVCVVLGFVAVTLPRTLKPVSREKAFVRDAGRYLKKHNPNGDLAVAGFDERVAFYAAARSVLIGSKIDAVRVSHYLREQKADYLAAEAKALATMLPEISRQPERYGLILERDFIGTHKDRMLVFRVS